MRETVNISLTKKLKEEVDNAVQSGQYSSRSEFFRDVIRLWKEKKLLHKLQNKTDNEKFLWSNASKKNLLNSYDQSDSIYDKV